MGRLLHEAGQLKEAEQVYREAVQVSGYDAVLLFNLAVLLDDMGRKPEAIETYGLALKRDPNLADCHYNLALLCQELGRPQEAIRHLSQYRRLTRTQPK